jgi:hypothetical protein
MVLYHGNCYDGFCAAWVARKRFPDAECVPVNYGDAPPNVAGRDVYILDFSYQRLVMLDIIAQARAVVVLDHHKTAAAELAGDLSVVVDGPSLRAPVIVFDMTKSGGRLTWEYFFSGQDVPWLVAYTEDRDLWRWALPHSRAINAWLRSHPFDFELWDVISKSRPLAFDGLRFPVGEGEAILRREKQIVDSHVGFAREVDIDGYHVLAVNATVLTSEIAGELAKDRPFGACWFERADGKRVWSLRSEKTDGVDVSEISKRHGGGGHRQAAGYEEQS